MEERWNEKEEKWAKFWNPLCEPSPYMFDFVIGLLHMLELDSNYRSGDNEEWWRRNMKKINFLLKGKLLWQGTNSVFLQRRKELWSQGEEALTPSMEGSAGGDSGYSKHSSTLPHKGPKVCQATPVSNSSPCHLFRKLEKKKKKERNSSLRSTSWQSLTQSVVPPVRPSMFQCPWMPKSSLYFKERHVALKLFSFRGKGQRAQLRPQVHVTFYNLNLFLIKLIKKN